MAEQDIINEMIRRVKDFNRRVRDLEEKVRNLNARVNTAEDTILEKTKKLNNEISDLDNGITEVQDKVAALEVDVKNLQRNMRKTVTKREFSEVKNYLDIMDPVKSSFVTRKEVENMMEDTGSGGMSKYEVNRMIERKIEDLQEDEA